MPKKIIYSILAVVSLLLLAPFALNYSGFCLADGEWTNEQDLIRQALVISNLSKTIRDNGHVYERITYDDPSELLAIDPVCCGLHNKINYSKYAKHKKLLWGEGPYAPSLLNKIMGRHNFTVTIIRKISSKDSTSREIVEGFTRSHYGFDKCGNLAKKYSS